MDKMINEAIVPLINDGYISKERVEHLIFIKEFIDSIASKMYLGESDVNAIYNRYGVKPNIVTWGDYFQTEMASTLLKVSDEEFIGALDTVKFDVMSAWEIFSNKDAEFFEMVDQWYYSLLGLDPAEYTEEEDEILHLKILKDYFVDMGITDKFTESMKLWYHSFAESAAI